MSDKPTAVDTPFHPGERMVQARFGVEESVAVFAQRAIRDHMPDQHRQFFSQLPFLILGGIDQDNQPWATVLTGKPGFIQSPDPRRLVVDAQTADYDPLYQQLGADAEVGLLGIEFHSRRRNRANGIIRQHRDENGYTIDIRQGFGNCPKYIQSRQLLAQDASESVIVTESAHLTAAMRLILNKSDTFFIASSFPSANSHDDRRQGVDVSHRGGRPGFVRVENNQLAIDDYPGNKYFNTLGNLSLNPKAGLLFIDFERGDLLYLAVTADIIWETAEINQCQINMQVNRAIWVQNALPWRWSEAQLSDRL